MNIHTEITIKASPDQVWKHLIDFESYHKWNPFIKYLSGEIKQGQTISLNIDGMKFKPELLAVDQSKKLEWIGHLWLNGIFDGTHTFELKDNGNGSTTLIHREHFSGLLVPLLKKKLQTDTVELFKSLNEALKARAEA